jgi:RNA polymerase sigma factor (sigma-70 family)
MSSITDRLDDVTTPTGDAELIAAVRAGDQEAFTELYERHRQAARVVAAQYAARSADVDDLVSEAFARMLRQLQDGKGPDSFFRAYLFTTIRNLASRTRQHDSRVRDTDDQAVLDRAVDHPDKNLEFFEQELVRGAFESLPERWQSVLWYISVEGLTPAQVAPILGLSANGVAALAYRAREGLRQAYLQQHTSTAVRDECYATAQKLGAYTRGALPIRDRTKVEAHLELCAECQTVVDELGDVNKSLRSVLAVLILGAAAPAMLDALTAAPPLSADAEAPALSAGSGGGAAQPAGVGARQGARFLRKLYSGGYGTPALVGAVTATFALVGGLVWGGIALLRPAPPAESEAGTTAEVVPGGADAARGPDPMAVVYSAQGKLAVTSVGAPLAVCAGAEPGCPPASSAASWEMPADGMVIHAQLYWAADSSGEGWTTAKLRGPGGEDQVVQAEREIGLRGGTQLSADVTHQVKSAGPGQWTVSNVHLAAQGPTEDRWAGWALLVVYESFQTVDSDQVATIYEGDLGVSGGGRQAQDVNVPTLRATGLVGVIWGGKGGDAATTAWMIDSESTTSIAQRLDAVDRAGSSAGGVEVLDADDAWFPEGTAAKKQAAVAVRVAGDTGGRIQDAGVVAVVAPMVAPAPK